MITNEISFPGETVVPGETDWIETDGLAYATASGRMNKKEKKVNEPTKYFKYVFMYIV